VKSTALIAELIYFVLPFAMNTFFGFVAELLTDKCGDLLYDFFFVSWRMHLAINMSITS
jgi:hypothetical protein